jgi:hypothetical protein
MFKFTPINAFSLRNLQNSQIYFNSPLNFNDPFDTFHPAEVTKISTSKFVELFGKSSKRNYNEKHLIEILDKTISKKDFCDFCEMHLDFIFDLENTIENQFFKNKGDLLIQIRNDEKIRNEFLDSVCKFFWNLYYKIQATTQETLFNIREETFSKIGVCCFSKNNTNLLMWAHYADSHQGVCLEFDPKYEPFSKSFNVQYGLEIPEVNSDLLYEKEDITESIQKLLSFKSLDWKHEEEIRIFHQESNRSYFYPAHSLKAIYFGLKTNPTDIEMICSIVKSKNQDVKFYQMIKLEKTFGIEAKQFHYNTVVEIQSGLVLIISSIFGKNEFTIEDLIAKGKIEIPIVDLEANVEDLIRKSILIKHKEKLKLNR